jgi:hypothetical protein
MTSSFYITHWDLNTKVVLENVPLNLINEFERLLKAQGLKVVSKSKHGKFNIKVVK